MNKAIFRIVLGVIWLIGGAVSLFYANYPIAAIFIAIGVVFLLAVRKGRNSSDEES